MTDLGMPALIEPPGPEGGPILNMHLSGGVYFTLPEHRIFLLDAYRERLTHFHFHDAKGKKNHLPLGAGSGGEKPSE